MTSVANDGLAQKRRHELRVQPMMMISIALLSRENAIALVHSYGAALSSMG